MNKDVAGNLFKACVVAAWLCLGSGCQRDADAAAAAAIVGADAAVAVDAAVAADAALVADLEGVWATSENTDSDDAETVYVIEAVGGGQLRISRDGTALDAQVEDVDPDQNTVTLRDQSGGGAVETLTFRKMEDENGTGGFNLKLTYGNGQTEALGFVRRLSARDRETLAAALATPAQPVMDDTAAASADCASATTFRARTVCADADLREQDALLMERFKFLTGRGSFDYESTRAAAMKQLDACNHSDCLRDVYAQWATYLDENYDAGDLSGMAE